MVADFLTPFKPKQKANSNQSCSKRISIYRSSLLTFAFLCLSLCLSLSLSLLGPRAPLSHLLMLPYFSWMSSGLASCRIHPHMVSTDKEGRLSFQNLPLACYGHLPFSIYFLTFHSSPANTTNINFHSLSLVFKSKSLMKI